MDAGLSFVKRNLGHLVHPPTGEYRESGNVPGAFRKIGNASKNIP